MTPTRIYLVRHGQVEGYEQKRYNGQAEVALTAEGQAQFGVLQLRLKNKKIRAVYSSNLSRCWEGAALLARSFELQPISKPELRELDIGQWEGTPWTDLQERYPKEWQARLDDLVNYRVPGGENLLDLAARVRPAIREILDAHAGEEVVVVGHGGVNRLILLDAIGAPLERLFHVEQTYGCLNIIEYSSDGRAVVKLLNG